MTGLDTDQLCEVANVPQGTLAAWINRGHLIAPPRVDGRRGWSVADVLAVTIFAQLLRRNRDMAAAGAEAVARAQALGELIRQMAAGRGTGAEMVVFIDATLTSGERWCRVATTARDVDAVLSAAQKRGLSRLELDDFTESYMSVMRAFEHARVGPVQDRQRVPA